MCLLVGGLNPTPDPCAESAQDAGDDDSGGKCPTARCEAARRGLGARACKTPDRGRQTVPRIMNTHAFDAMGTQWCFMSERAADFDAAEQFVRRCEASFSRFSPYSALSELNRRRAIQDAQLTELVEVAMALHALTNGAFDPTLGDELSALGYDRTFAPELNRGQVSRRSNLLVKTAGDITELEGEGSLDLGGIAKGWTVDAVAMRLRQESGGGVLVDGGGDIRAIDGVWNIGVGDGREVILKNAGVATSSTLRRRWEGGTHHIVDPDTGQSSAQTIDTATVVASDATLADALATAVIVNPQLLSDPRIPIQQAIVRARDGQWWTTPNWRVEP
ncbi:MAG: FAD:protein FMN transferase [bacterium]